MVTFTPQSALSDALLAVGLPDFIGASNVDTVAVYDAGDNQVFADARPLRVDVLPRARLMEHPLENGQVTTDYKIILPLEIRMSVLINSENYTIAYQAIRNLWKNSDLLTVQTRTGGYANMVIAELPHEERPDRFDAVTVNLVFKQIPLVGQTDNFKPINPVQSNTTVLGYQMPSLYTIAGTVSGGISTARVISRSVL